MKRKVMKIDQIRDEVRDYWAAFGEDADSMGIMSLVEVENMGFCRDGVTRWYAFTNESGEACIYFKH